MSFAVAPALAVALVAVPLAALLLYAARRAAARRRAIARARVLEQQGAGIEAWRDTAQTVLIVVAVLALALALARPRAGSERQQLGRRGADILLVLDVSNSMKVEDVRPSRLERAKRIARAVLPGTGALDRVGLVSFAEQATMECPLTADLDVLTMRLDEIRAGSIGEGSSDLLPAVQQILRQFPDKTRPGLAVVLSDGEDHAKRVDAPALEQLSRSGAVAVCVGIGTPKGGPVPAGQGLFIHPYEMWNGTTAISRLEEESLKGLAGATGGEYISGGTVTEGAAAAQVIALRERVTREREEGQKTAPVARELFQIPLAIACAALIAEAVIGNAPPRRRRAPR